MIKSKAPLFLFYGFYTVRILSYYLIINNIIQVFTDIVQLLQK